MKLEQLKTAIEKSGQLQLQYVERDSNGNFDGIYAAVLDTHSVLQTPLLGTAQARFPPKQEPGGSSRGSGALRC